MYTKTKNENKNKTAKITLRISKDRPSNEGKSKIRYIKQIIRISRI